MKKYYKETNIIEHSIWPILTTLSLSYILINIVMCINNIRYSETIILSNIIWLGINIYNWNNEIIKESLYKGLHTEKMNNTQLKGFIWFVLSELLIFLSLFYSYFYNTLQPNIELDVLYPPKGIIPIPFNGLAILNTSLLLFGSVTITAAIHGYNIYNKKYKYKWINIMILLTIILNTKFTYLQYIEYKEAQFTINSGIFGSNFYIITGLHGLHVIGGTLLLLIMYIRYLKYNFTHNSYLLPIIASTYTHFVDVIWLVVFTFLYSWL